MFTKNWNKRKKLHGRRTEKSLIFSLIFIIQTVFLFTRYLVPLFQASVHYSYI